MNDSDVAPGDCFEASLAFMVECRRKGSADRFVLVHGEVVRDTDALHHVHAWVEVRLGGQWWCINVAGGRRLMAGREWYYDCGCIDIAKTSRYTFEEALRFIGQTGTCGPWDEYLNEVQDTAIRTEKERLYGIRSE